MARHRSHRRKSLRMRGGSYTSASTYGQYVSGDMNSQWSRTMDQSGAYGQVPGNAIIGAQGQNVIPASQMPTSAQLDLIQKAGRRRHRKGGFLGEVVSQAVVPFGLLGMQQTYRRRRGGRSRRTRRHRKH